MIETRLAKKDNIDTMQYKYDISLLMEKYKRLYCDKCKNKKTTLCNITRTIDNKIKCTEYERKD